MRSGAKIFVETGTWRGDSLFYLRKRFAELHSIEFMPELYTTNVKALRHLPNVFLYHGDSGILLSALVRNIRLPCVFWLDGHYSGPGTGRSESDTPILAELDVLLVRNQERDTILIDDARLFTGNDGYPTMESLRKLVASKRPQALFRVEDDVIEIWDAQ